MTKTRIEKTFSNGEFEEQQDFDNFMQDDERKIFTFKKSIHNGICINPRGKTIRTKTTTTTR